MCTKAALSGSVALVVDRFGIDALVAPTVVVGGEPATLNAGDRAWWSIENANDDGV